MLEQSTAQKVKEIPRPGPGKIIDNDVRAAIHVLNEEGLSNEKIGHMCKIAKGSVFNILKEDTSGYEDKIDRIKADSLDNWIKIRSLSQDSTIKSLEGVKSCPIVPPTLLPVLIKCADVAQTKESLLTGDATSREDHTGDIKHRHIREMDEAERLVAAKQLLSTFTDILPNGLPVMPNLDAQEATGGQKSDETMSDTTESDTG